MEEISRASDGYYDWIPIRAHVPDGAEPPRSEKGRVPTERALARDEAEQRLGSYAMRLLGCCTYDLPREYERMYLVKRGLEHASQLLAGLLAEHAVDFTHATECLHIVQERLDHEYETVAAVAHLPEGETTVVTHTRSDDVHRLVEHIVQKEILLLYGEQYAAEYIRRLRCSLSQQQAQQLLRVVREHLHRAFSALHHGHEARSAMPDLCRRERPSEKTLRSKSTVEATIYLWVSRAMKQLFREDRAVQCTHSFSSHRQSWQECAGE